MATIDQALPAHKYLQIADALTAEIRRGAGVLGQRFRSDREIMRHFGVSVVTVRQAVEQLVRKGLLQRRPGLGTFLVSREVAVPRTSEIGLLVFSLEGEASLGYGFQYAGWIRGVMEGARLGGRRVSLLDVIPESGARERVENYARGSTSCSGFVFAEAAEWCEGAIRILRERSVPYVMLERCAWDPDANTCFLNARRAGELAANHLLALGHRQLAYVGRTGDERCAGFLAAARAANAEPPPEWMVDDDGRGGLPASFANGMRAGRALLDGIRRPTGVYAGNDARALGFLEAARERGVDVPGELSVVGTDDLPDAMLSECTLTTLRWPLAELGRQAVLRLQEWERQGDAYRPGPQALAPELIVRGSTGPVPRGAEA